jgi:hypothetical protein
MSNTHVTEQNARDLYKLNECDNEFVTLIRGWPIFGEKRYVYGIRHAEYYHLNKYIKAIEQFIQRKSGIESMEELHKARDLFLKLSNNSFVPRTWKNGPSFSSWIPIMNDATSNWPP